MTKHYRLLMTAVLLVFGVGISQAQEATLVKGRVTDATDGTGLPGVNILEKGSQNGTLTDNNGDFSITTEKGKTLIFSFVGFIPQEILVGDQTSFNISLIADITQLGEIVVIGYGQQKKSDLTGSVVALGTKDFNKGVMTSPQELLLGRVAGVSINTNSGAPGANSTIRIRGGASMKASNDPLIVIDGFPVDNSELAGLANPLSTLNPNDIESYVVLKDASATAIYGSRASNGVIIITTKKGKEGKPTFTYDGNVSVSSPIKYMDVLTGDEYRTLVNELAETGVSGLNPAVAATLGTENTNWQKEIYQDAISNNHNLSVAGSYKNLPYRVSYGYTNQEGILKTTGLERHSLNISLTPSFLDDHLKVSVNAKGSHIYNNFGEDKAVGNAITFDPTRPVRDGNTEYGGYFSWLSLNAVNGTSNPVAQLMQTDNTSISNRIIANAQVEYKLHALPELKLVLNTGFDRSESDGHNRAGLDAEFTDNNNTPPVLLGRDNIYTGKNQSELLDLYFNYNKVIGIHKVDFTGGYGWQHFSREKHTQDKDISQTKTFDSKNENFLLSFFGRLNYTLSDKYLFTATLRSDGSSRFTDHWGLFPSLAFAWRINDESFMSGIDALSDLKLRIGYGQTGQQDVSDNQYPNLPIYRGSTATAQYQLGNTFYNTLRPEPYDANIKWETTSTYNLGLDFGIFNDKFRGSVDLYRRETYDLLNYIQVPSGTNFSNYLTTNVGNLTNQGIEITLSGTPITTTDFSWNAGFNFTYNVNDVTKLLLVDDPNYAGVYGGNVGVGANVQNSQIGFPVNSFYVYQQVYNVDGSPIEGLYVDRAGEGGVVTNNESNKYHDEKPAANILMGVNSRFNYKKFDFSFSGRISLGNYVYNNNIASRAFYNRAYQLGFFSNIPTAITDTKFVNQQTYSDYYVQDASFFKMDNMSLGYNVDRLFSDKLKARISMTVQNAFIITKYDGMDPEVNGGTDKIGIDNGIYPRPRVFLLGVNVSF